ncbi:MAG: hypothetical protein KatS3mg110_0167 [Pirellulaceae bacterium]|nr:MAG: hypothetical protein KatS3mg110_0167 [Pirellulaceae bacterium]
MGVLRVCRFGCRMHIGPMVLEQSVKWESQEATRLVY